VRTRMPGGVGGEAELTPGSPIPIYLVQLDKTVREEI
jgi:hypothetical protein